MRLGTILLTTGLALFSSEAFAQDRARTSPTQTQNTTTLAGPKVDNSIEKFSCILDGVHMTADGLAYFCYRTRSLGKMATVYLIVPDMNVNASSTRAAVDLLNNIQNNKARVANRIKGPTKTAKRVCALILGTGAQPEEVECKSAISFGWESNRIKVGNAKP